MVFQGRRKEFVSAHLILSRSQSDLILVQLYLLANGNILRPEKKSISNYFTLKEKKSP